MSENAYRVRRSPREARTRRSDYKGQTPDRREQISGAFKASKSATRLAQQAGWEWLALRGGRGGILCSQHRAESDEPTGTCGASNWSFKQLNLLIKLAKLTTTSNGY